jgi:hypothetical protein
MAALPRAVAAHQSITGPFGVVEDVVGQRTAAL